MNRNLWLLAVLQGLFLTNNIVFIAINGLVGLALAPYGWMATVPVMAYVLGGALFTGPVAIAQSRLGRQRSFQLGLLAAILAALLCAYAAFTRNFWLLSAGTLFAGYYAANASLYRFASAELAPPAAREKAVSLVMAGGLLGAVLGPNLAVHTRDLASAPFAGAYITLAGVAALAMVLMSFMQFPPVVPRVKGAPSGRSVANLLRQPVFLVAALAGGLGFGVMNLLMASTPLAMQQCGLPFPDAALVLQWHVIGMFAPGFFTGRLIKRFGPLPIMGIGVALNAAGIAMALAGVELHNFLAALFVLGVGWNFLFTGSTVLALASYAPEEKDRAQGVLNFFVFATLACSSLASGVLVTTQGWAWLNAGSLAPVMVVAASLLWLGLRTGRPATA